MEKHGKAWSGWNGWSGAATRGSVESPPVISNFDGQRVHYYIPS